MRDSARATIVGRAKVMSYEDILEAQRKRSEREKQTSENASRALFMNSTSNLEVRTAKMLTDAEEEALESAKGIQLIGSTRYRRILNFDPS